MLTAMVEIMINKLIMVWLTMMIMIIMIKKIAMLILNINRVLVIEFAIAFGSSWSMFLVPKRTTTSLTDGGTDKSPVFHKVHWGLFLDMPQFCVLYGLKYFCHTMGYLFNPASMESQINTIDGYNQFANKSWPSCDLCQAKLLLRLVYVVAKSYWLLVFINSLQVQCDRDYV